MWKLTVALFLLFIVFAITDGMMEGGGGVQATKLNGAITEESTIITVDDASYFASANKTIIIGSEMIYYTSRDDTHFYTSIEYRGYNDTDIETHNDNANVYTVPASVVNDMFGNVSVFLHEIGDTTQVAESSPVLGRDFWIKTFPKLLTWDFSILGGDLVIVRYCLMGASILLLALIAMKMIPFVNF